MKSLTIVGTIGFASSWWPRLLPKRLLAPKPDTSPNNRL